MLRSRLFKQLKDEPTVKQNRSVMLSGWRMVEAMVCRSGNTLIFIANGCSKEQTLFVHDSTHDHLLGEPGHGVGPIGMPGLIGVGLIGVGSIGIHGKGYLSL